MADERTPLVPTNVQEVRISANVEGRISTNGEGRIMKLILFVVFSSVCTLDGTLYSNGLLKNGLKADKGVNPTSLEYVGAVQVGLCCITSFFAAKVERWLGPRLAVGGGAALSALDGSWPLNWAQDLGLLLFFKQCSLVSGTDLYSCPQSALLPMSNLRLLGG